MVTTALLPVSRLVTFAVVPSGRVLLAALSLCGCMTVPSAIFLPENFLAYNEAFPRRIWPERSSGGLAATGSCTGPAGCALDGGGGELDSSALAPMLQTMKIPARETPAVEAIAARNANTRFIVA